MLKKAVKPYPPTYEGVGNFITRLVVQRNGSAKSIATVIAAIKFKTESLNLEWLTAHEQRQLKRLVQQMQYVDPYPTDRKVGLQIKHLVPWSKSMDLDDLFQLEEMCIMWLGHNALLRSGKML